LSEPTQQFRALLSSPEATEHSEINNDRRGSDFNRSTTLTLEPKPCAGGQCATLVFAGQSEKEDEVHATAASLLRVSDDSAIDDGRRFSSSEILKVATPDAEANRAIQWAQIALEQAWTDVQCASQLRCGRRLWTFAQFARESFHPIVVFDSSRIIQTAVRKINS
jgi:hypothetical protein